MSVGTRKVLFINGQEIDTEQDSITYDLGGLEGEEVMADNRFAGMSRKAMPGNVKAKVVNNANLDKALWDATAEFDIEVAHPEIGKAAVFSGMRQKMTFKGDGAAVEIEFGGPEGTYA